MFQGDFGTTVLNGVLKLCHELLTLCSLSTDVTGESIDISEYIDISLFYDLVHFIEGERLEAPSIGRWLGIASHIGGCMTYYILKANGQMLARSSMRRVTNLEQQTTEVKESMAEFAKTVEASLKDANFMVNIEYRSKDAT